MTIAYAATIERNIPISNINAKNVTAMGFPEVFV